MRWTANSRSIDIQAEGGLLSMYVCASERLHFYRKIDTV